MRFPLPLTLKIASTLLKQRWRAVSRFATVLQLEPLHACNLACTGCGRIREYASTIRDMMPLADCLAAAAECDAPMVSICGGEPLLYPEIEALVAGLRDQKRIVYLCTNALIMRRKMSDYLAVQWSEEPRRFEPILYQLILEKLISHKEAAVIRSGRIDKKRPVIKPSRWFYWNIHLDGLEATHDRIVEKSGVFKECVLAIRMAKILGYQVATNTTIYKQTKMVEIEELWSFLGTLGVDGHTITPGYDYAEAAEAMVRRKQGRPEDFFLTRADTIEKFRNAEEWGRRFPLLGTPVYLEFLAGKRELSCSAWAIPTRNVRGWKGPCYLITDAHYASYRELIEATDWDRLGRVNGVARDPRCEHCMVHCGHEPTATLGINAQRGDIWKNLRFNFGPRPRITAKR
jgi:hopanoid biosynthesis associated radical SAM protein HpnH